MDFLFTHPSLAESVLPQAAQLDMHFYGSCSHHKQRCNFLNYLNALHIKGRKIRKKRTSPNLGTHQFSFKTIQVHPKLPELVPGTCKSFILYEYIVQFCFFYSYFVYFCLQFSMVAQYRQVFNWALNCFVFLLRNFAEHLSARPIFCLLTETFGN